MSNIIECRSVCFSYTEGNNQTPVLRNLNLEVSSGDSIAILGQSGCGKSTLLNLIAGLDHPTEGEVLVNNINISELDEKNRTDLRSNNLGFIFQFHHLLNDFTSLYNVALPLLINGSNIDNTIALSTKLLTDVGLENRLNHKPSELSGGERQRVAIARAMITKPACLIADEPTGNLDSKNAEGILELIIDLNSKATSALLIVTHDLGIANKMERKLNLADQELVEI
ncbi:ABC transporter ATP-binding protein [Candidatus Thioglobus sp. NP1]|uniref:ABC transporter ATP-binding protein n=1 Tax=Candidatus Thioglobus sp. NP1 TaxID=2508687 RepID=UPI000DED826F|nr:ABC transporter ATP-binding protein [Candidatus Thioglobus sp. NP1]AXE61764.1 lipoprotein-releasing system ATP-binding protein LolD [Candidatus Thioglobus sp. NP1]